MPNASHNDVSDDKQTAWRKPWRDTLISLVEKPSYTFRVGFLNINGWPKDPFDPKKQQLQSIINNHDFDAFAMTEMKRYWPALPIQDWRTHVQMVAVASHFTGIQQRFQASSSFPPWRHSGIQPQSCSKPRDEEWSGPIRSRTLDMDPIPGSRRDYATCCVGLLPCDQQKWSDVGV